MTEIRFLRQILAGFRGYPELITGRVGSIVEQERPPLLLSGDKVPDIPPLPFADAVDAGWRTAISAAARSVCSIWAEDNATPPAMTLVASGFRLGADTLIWTAAHVAQALLQPGATLAPGVRPKPASGGLRRAEVKFDGLADPITVEEVELLWDQREMDLMVLRLQSGAPRASLAIGAAPAAVVYGLPICAVGYPVTAPRDGEELKLLKDYFGDPPQVRVKRASPGVIPRFDPAEVAITPSVLHDATTLPGSSGSAVLDLSGRLMGLHYAGRSGADDPNDFILFPGGADSRPTIAALAAGAADIPPWQPRDGAKVQVGTAFVELEVQSGALEAARRDALPEAAPAVLADRRDVRDRLYVPPLSPPDARVEPPEGLRVRRQRLKTECVGKALAAAIDLQLARQDRTEFAPEGVSARMLYEMARLHDEFVDDAIGGSSLRGGIKGFFHNGVCSERTTSAALGPGWHFTREMAKEARRCTLGAYYRLRSSLPDFQMAIQEAGAVVVSAWTHRGWEAPRRGRVRRPARALPDRAHAFVLVGYDEEGFIVQNSLGAGWGKDGRAHWSYADWAQSVIDAWVLQLAPLAPEAHNLRLQAYAAADPETPSELPPALAALPEPRRMAIIGHLVHAERTGLVDLGRLGLGVAALRETALYLAEGSKYPDLAFLFHDPTLGPEAAARVSAFLIPPMKSAGIYPMNVLYGSDEIRSLTARMEDEAAFCHRISGNSREDLTAFLERRARQICMPLLEGFLSGAAAAAEPGRPLWTVLAGLGFESARVLGGNGRWRRRRIHVVAWGLGATVASAAFRDPARAGFSVSAGQALDSVTLFAPLGHGPHASGSSLGWPLRRGEPLVVPLSNERPRDWVMPGYTGDWVDLIVALMPDGGVRAVRARGGEAGSLSELAASPAGATALIRQIRRTRK